MGLGSGQIDPEAAATDAVRFKAGFSAHSFDRLFDDGQADACAAVLIVLMNPFEHSEQPGLVFGFDANAIVFDPQTNLVLAELGPNLEFRDSSRDHELNAIGEEIGN